MAKPTWNKTLGEVLGYETQRAYLKSKNGGDYETDIIPVLNVVSTGIVEEFGNEWRYSIVDTKNDLEYQIKAPNYVETKFGMRLDFLNVSGGATDRGGWFKALEVKSATNVTK